MDEELEDVIKSLNEEIADSDPNTQDSIEETFDSQSNDPQLSTDEPMPSSKSEEERLLSCSICLELMEDAQATICGHSYCRRCISRAVAENQKCPDCATSLTENDYFPNLQIKEVIIKFKERIALMNNEEMSSLKMREFVANKSQELNLEDINKLLDMLEQRKCLLELHERAIQAILLCEFFDKFATVLEEKGEELDAEYEVIKNDLELTRKAMENDNSESSEGASAEAGTSAVDESKASESMEDEPSYIARKVRKTLRSLVKETTSNVPTRDEKQFLNKHFESLVECYNEVRVKKLLEDKENAELVEAGLNEFRNDLEKCSRYKVMRVMASIDYHKPEKMSSVSSVEMDKSKKYFATAGYAHEIRIYDYVKITGNPLADHQPHCIIPTEAKLSCLSWTHSDEEQYIASSDNEGAVIVWDAVSKTRVQSFCEHEKRCWSVDFNAVDTRLLASGADDRAVKVWSLNQRNSTFTWIATGQVCCVRFHPSSSCHLAYGVSDHNIYYYDIRNIQRPLQELKGHGKTVSYVKFLDDNHLASVSTDATIKIWTLSDGHCIRTLTGHANDKNYIGFATNADYIVCGSEDNKIHLYYKKIRKPIVTHGYDSTTEFTSLLGSKMSDVVENSFVSALCWGPQSDILIAGNSRGAVKVLKLE